MQKYYKAEMDRLLRITTRLVGVLFLIPPAALAFVWYKVKYAPPGCRPPPPFIEQHLGSGLLLFIVLMAVTAYLTKAMAPRGYAVNDVELLIDREIKPVTIPLAEILEVRQLESGLLRRSMRLFGSAGYYGYYGLFWNRKMGKFRVYSTRLEDLAVVRTGKALFVLSPENLEDFISTLRGLLPRLNNRG